MIKGEKQRSPSEGGGGPVGREPRAAARTAWLGGLPRATGTSRDVTPNQQLKTARILDAALDVFSTNGFRGATLDQVANSAGPSKPNLLYYFASKEAVHRVLLEQLLDTWLEPLQRLDPEGEPLAEIRAYIRRKLTMARLLPRESRLFANEMLQGAPVIGDVLEGPLRALVDQKAAVLLAWMNDGRLAQVDPHHLIFSIWVTTQHYADFDVQVTAVLGQDDDTRFADAERFLVGLFERGLRPAAAASNSEAAKGYKVW
jgi:TetR/AcrR family transcriptional regulator